MLSSSFFSFSYLSHSLVLTLIRKKKRSSSFCCFDTFHQVASDIIDPEIKRKQTNYPDKQIMGWQKLIETWLINDLKKVSILWKIKWVTRMFNPLRIKSQAWSERQFFTSFSCRVDSMSPIYFLILSSLWYFYRFSVFLAPPLKTAEKKEEKKTGVNFVTLNGKIGREKKFSSFQKQPIKLPDGINRRQFKVEIKEIDPNNFFCAAAAASTLRGKLKYNSVEL